MEEYKEIFCSITKVEENTDSKQIKYPKEIYNLIINKGKNVLSVITHEAKKIVLFPTNAESGIYAKIFIKRKKGGLDDSFFISLRKVTLKFKLKTLFTTGVCVKQDECFWEGIFEHKENFPIEDFKNTLNKINSVLSIKLNILSPSV